MFNGNYSTLLVCLHAVSTDDNSAKLNIDFLTLKKGMTLILFGEQNVLMQWFRNCGLGHELIFGGS